MSAEAGNQDLMDLAASVLDLAKKAGALEGRVKIAAKRFVEVRYRLRRPEEVKEALTRELTFEAYMGGRCAGQTTSDLRASALDEFVRDTVAHAKIMEADLCRSLPDPQCYFPRTQENLGLTDPGHDSYTAPDRHRTAREVEEACLSLGGDKLISAEAGYFDHAYAEYVQSSNGLFGHLKATEYWVAAIMTLQDQGDRKPAAWSEAGGRLRAGLPSPQVFGAEVAQRAKNSLGARKIKTETLPIIIENRLAPRLLAGFVNAMNGGNVQQKQSFLADKIGKKVGSDVFSLADDPHLPGGLGTRPYDGEGLATKRRDMVYQGVLDDFFVDWYYSRKLKCQPTTAGPTNLLLPPGTRSLTEIVKSLGRCVLVTDFIGGNSNSTTGDFSFGVAGLLYDRGEPAQAVAEMNIAGNHLDFWNRLVEAANDPWLYNSYRLPSLVFDNVVVSGK